MSIHRVRDELTLPLIFAHRGASQLAPENTFAAFELAYELGALAIECDVQMSADFIPLIIHDETLQRTTNGHGEVAARTAADIEQLSAGAWFDERFSQERVPRLTDLLSALRPLELYINLEIKPNRLSVAHLVDAVLMVLKQHHYPQEKIMLSSFDRAVIERLAQHSSETMPSYALLIEEDQLDAISFAQKHACSSINPHVDILRKHGADWIQQCHAAGLQVNSFTLNDPDEIKFFLAAGLDGFFTDNHLLYKQKS